jgi:hypothetical protein
MNNLQLSRLWAVFSFLCLTLTGIFAINLPIRGDEGHIVETIRFFAKNFNIDTIKNYPEVTPRFFYIIYAIWANIFGGSLESLRLFNLIIAFTAWQFLFYLIKFFIKNKIHVFLLSLFIVINPYFFGASIFVFTDIITIMFSLAAVIFFIKDRLLYYIIFCILALLCRQYAVIIPLAVIIYSSLNFAKNKRTNKTFIVGSFITLVPLIILFTIWKNIAPAYGVEKWIVPNSSIYNLDYINTYLTFSVIYILPLAIFFFKKVEFNYNSLIIAFLFAALLSFFPIKASLATLRFTDYRTVGIVHQIFAGFFGLENIGLKIILWLLLFAGCYINTELLKRVYVLIKLKSSDKEIIFTLLWFLFLLIMPFSYQVWEKYLTLVLPFLVINIYLLMFANQQKLDS